jgi:hypothetical protein
VLRRESWAVNHKRVHRLHGEEGLSIRTNCRAASGPGGIDRAAGDHRADDSWAMDFIPTPCSMVAPSGC